MDYGSRQSNRVVKQQVTTEQAAIRGRDDLVPSHVKQIIQDRFQQLAGLAEQAKFQTEIKSGISDDPALASFHDHLNSLSENDRQWFDREYSSRVLQEAARLLGRIPTSSPVQFTSEMYERAYAYLLHAQILLDDVLVLPCEWATTTRAIAAGIEHDIIGAVGNSKETFLGLRRRPDRAASEEEPACMQVSFCRCALRAQLAIHHAQAREEAFEPRVRLLPGLRQASREGALVCDGRVIVAFSNDNLSVIDSTPDFVVKLQTSRAKEIFGDSDLLNLTLFNIIKNAIRENTNFPDLIVTISIENNADSTHTSISVRDNGVGFPIEKLRTRLYERASKRQTSGRDLGDFDKKLLEDAEAIEESELLMTLFERGFGVSSGGTGLGLSIVKEAITLMRAELLLRNHPEGGAEILLSIPKP